MKEIVFALIFCHMLLVLACLSEYGYNIYRIVKIYKNEKKILCHCWIGFRLTLKMILKNLILCFIPLFNFINFLLNDEMTIPAQCNMVNFYIK